MTPGKESPNAPSASGPVVLKNLLAHHFLRGQRVTVDEHGIAVTKETVLLSHRLMVSIHGVFVSGKRRHQHDQGRFRQMEVRYQGINHLIVITRIDEYLSITEERCNQRIFAGFRGT